MILKAQMQSVGARQPMLVRLWPVPYRRYGILITVGGVGGDFSQTVQCQWLCRGISISNKYYLSMFWRW